MMEPQCRISEFYREKNVFITGASGFIGKVLVEKLLRSCPDIGNIYLLIRSKRGQNVQQRLQEILNQKLFDHMRSDRDRLNKVIAVSGDIGLPELGLSESDKRLLIDNVSIVFHSAATVKFNETLKTSVNINLMGTKEMINLCLAMPKLEAFIHVSTAYCHCDKKELQERVYPPPNDPEKIIKAMTALDDPLVEHITPRLLKSYPNTYVYTKALAESLLMEQSGRIPAAIVRPSIVVGGWQEPMPGWVDSLYGPTGIIAGGGKGILRSIHCDRSMIADLIPVDFVINLLIASAWYTATARPNNILVYNCTSSSTNPVTWGDFEKQGLKNVLKYPYSDVLWYPGGSMKSSLLLHQISCILFQVIPAYIVDLFSWMTGKKPIMARVQTKIIGALDQIDYFLNHEFKFYNHNTMKLWSDLNQEEQKIFNFDVRVIEWGPFFEKYVLGTRNFLMKDDSSTLPSARSHLKKLYYIEKVSQIVLMLFFFRIMVANYDNIKSTWYYMLKFMFKIFKSIASPFGKSPQLTG